MEHTGLAPWRLGATSYVVPGDLAANARYLGGLVDDMEVVLFDAPGGPSNLPSAAQIGELAAIARGEGLTYTVHLPSDLPAQLAGEPMHPLLLKAQRLIGDMQALSPFAYVFHLDGKAVRDPSTPSVFLHRWQDGARRTLDLLSEWAGDPSLLALENVEGYDLGFYDDVVGSRARCIDVGHLWVDGHEATAYLHTRLTNARVIHLHGLAGKDHLSLAHTPAAQLDPVLSTLAAHRFNGVVTLEVFEADFPTSLKAYSSAMHRVLRSGE